MQLSFLKSYIVRHAISIGFIVLIATYINIYFSFSHEYWIALTAFIVGQSRRNATPRQGMVVFLVCLIAMLLGTILKLIVLKQTVLYLILGFIFLLGGYLIYLNYLFANKIFTLVLFVLVVLMAALSPFSAHFMLKLRVLDMMIGAGIGMIFAPIILPVKIYNEFREGVLPSLHAMLDHTKIIIDYLKQPAHDKTLTQIKFYGEEGSYPAWVFDAGFNHELRAGYRFFLIHLGWVTEIFVVIHYRILHITNIESIKLLSQPLSLVMEKNEELLSCLIQYFENGNIKDTESDFKTDMLMLEETLKQYIPASIELLDIEPQYIAMTALVSTIKDLRSMLLQLLVSLPTQAKSLTQ